MLIEFTISNFRSIKDECCLSLVASHGDELRDNNVIKPKLPKGVKPLSLLRSAVIYGPNAAGKSNVLMAMDCMHKIVCQLSYAIHDASLPVTPFKLDAKSAKKPSQFEVIILVDGVRYQYGFSATAKQIYNEWLFAFPKGNPQKWFERSYNPTTKRTSFTFGRMLKGDKLVWQKATRPNALFLSTAIQLNSSALKPVYHWFENTLRSTGLDSLPSEFSVYACHNKKRKNKILKFMQAADFSIHDIKVEKRATDGAELKDALLTQMFSKISSGRHRISSGSKILMTSSHKVHGVPNRYIDLDFFSEESAGTQKIFHIAAPWLSALRNGAVMFVDELHPNLHPKLVEFLIALFHSPKTNPKGAQLIFTTHETSILNQKIFRRDQIWFCERNKRQETVLCPLTDYKPRTNENLERAYLSGRYGAVPNIRDIDDLDMEFREKNGKAKT